MVAKLEGDRSAPQSSMELYYPWILDPSAFPEYMLPIEAGRRKTSQKCDRVGQLQNRKLPKSEHY